MLAIYLLASIMELMASPRNLTDQITKLRAREGGFSADMSAAIEPAKASLKERKLAPDLFMLFCYSLFFIAITAQLILIVSLNML
jgi:hypothetical protein